MGGDVGGNSETVGEDGSFQTDDDLFACIIIEGRALGGAADALLIAIDEEASSLSMAVAALGGV
jgi:hypothetical protein